MTFHIYGFLMRNNEWKQRLEPKRYYLGDEFVYDIAKSNWSKYFGVVHLLILNSWNITLLFLLLMPVCFP